VTAHVANLVRWEWFKLRRRWMPWILLAVLLLFSQLLMWGHFFAYRSMVGSELDQSSFQAGFVGPDGREMVVSFNCADVLAGHVADLPPGADPRFIEDINQNVEELRADCERAAARRQEELQELRAGFILPGSITRGLTVAQGIGLILFSILTVSTLGTEYGWGTLRSVLVRGTGRWQYLTAKLALLALLAVGALGVVALVTVLGSLVAGAVAPEDAGSGNGAASWSEGAITFGRAWFALLPYVALAGFATVLTRSSAAGMAAALGYFFVEQIGVAILIGLFDWFQTVADYILGRNITAWMLGSQSGGMGDVGGATFGMGIRIGEYPGELHAFLVLLAYILVLGGLGFWLFQRRDVAGTSGG